MDQNPYKAPDQETGITVPLGWLLEAASEFAGGIMIAVISAVVVVVLGVIVVAICIGTYYAMSYLSPE